MTSPRRKFLMSQFMEERVAGLHGSWTRVAESLGYSVAGTQVPESLGYWVAAEPRSNQATEQPRNRATQQPPRPSRVTLGVAMSPDNDLFARLRRGDHSAFESLYDRHSPAMYAIALRIAGREDLACTALEATFLGLWEGRLTYHP